MSYRIRPGIALINICGTHLLAAERAVWEECPRVRQIPRLWAACWTIMEKGKTDQDVVEAFTDLVSGSEEDIRVRLGKVFTQMYEEGYLLKTENDEG